MTRQSVSTQENKGSATPAELVVGAATLFALGYGLITLVGALVSSELATPVTLHLDPNSFTGDVPRGAGELHTLTAQTSAEVGVWSRLSWWLFTGARGFVLAAGLELLRRIVGSQATPFTATNVTRLRAIAGFAIVFQAIELLRGPVDAVLARQVGYGEIATNEQLFAPLVVAVFAGVLAQVWGAGIRLRTENELTI